MPVKIGDLVTREAVFLQREDSTPDYVVEAIVCTYGVKDTYETKFTKGCFMPSPDVVMFYGHDYNRIPIGKVIEMRDLEASDPRVAAIPGATGALYCKFELTKDIESARDAFAAIKHGTLKGFSVGFRAVEIEFDKEDDVTFTKCELKEVSAVPFPSVPGTKTVSARSAHGQTLSEELTSALAVVEGCIHRFEAVNEARKESERTVSKTHIPSLVELEKRVQSLLTELRRGDQELELAKAKALAL